ncbi:transmembrane protease serine 2 [Caerostris darwini]|uniref:limulus clotting factor C n=1 Tax=Caerostris darwini TaxID=1538125 RepID=A0AAV4WB24_9ARAC|nr:transmembrane protease serine 2 [Caerostris darwini]
MPTKSLYMRSDDINLDMDTTYGTDWDIITDVDTDIDSNIDTDLETNSGSRFSYRNRDFLTHVVSDMDTHTDEKNMDMDLDDAELNNNDYEDEEDMIITDGDGFNKTRRSIDDQDEDYPDEESETDYPDEETGTDESDEEAEIDDQDENFTKWTEWTECSRRCYQVKERKCLNEDECGTLIQKKYRVCNYGKCLHEDDMSDLELDENEKRKKYFHLVTNWDNYLYSEWSRWSHCGDNCYTERIRECKRPAMCGRNYKEQYKRCYTEGGACEEKYKEQLLLAVNYTESDLDKNHPLYNTKCGVSDVPIDLRITGGKKVIKGYWPWQALILNDNFEPFCGGIILSKEWVLTAAHCVRDRLYVRVGEHNLSMFEGTEQQVRVGAIYVHPDYNAKTVNNDMMLLRMRIPFEFTHFVKPICLPDGDDSLQSEARVTILGWGKRRDEANYGTDVLHQADVPVVSLAECRSAYSKFWINANMLCAGYLTGKVDSCRGDSGGPLMHKKKDGTWAVYGSSLISKRSTCAQKDHGSDTIKPTMEEPIEDLPEDRGNIDVEIQENIVKNGRNGDAEGENMDMEDEEGVDEEKCDYNFDANVEE